MLNYKVFNLFIVFIVLMIFTSCVESSKLSIGFPIKSSVGTGTKNNLAPVLDFISNQVVNESVAINSIDAAENGNDLDRDSEIISYSCFYDSTIDGVVNPVSQCSSIAHLSFSSTTGIMNWTPDYTQSGNYEFTIVGTDGVLSDSKIFSITVNNVNRAPVLAVIADQVVNESVAIGTINANDGGDDLDADGENITYSCYYDSAVDGSVASVSSCTTLSGVSFATNTGVVNWTPDLSQSGSYEFKIIGTDGTLSGEEIFSITVNEINQAPILDAIANQTVNENVAITVINAADAGDDLDADGQTITYTCFYDSTVDAAVASVTACSSLAGVSFIGATGAMSWTPSYSQSGNYEFKIVGSDGSLSDNKIFSITVNNVNRSPVLDAIANETVSEGIAITTINAGDGNDDFDIDNDALTYSCYYDNTVNGAVTAVNSCTTISGLTFSSSTGVMNWMPNLTQSGNYEFIISASDGSLASSRIFSITVNNSNQAPLLDSIADQTVNEGIAITTIDAGDSGDDLDRDGETITYSCYFDTTINGAVASIAACSTLTGVTFSAATGVMNWMPDLSQAGDYEFKIIGSDGSLTDDDIFSVIVNNTNAAPVIDTIADQTTSEGVAITTVNADDGGDDFDYDGTAITYTCYYDTLVNAAVANTNACATLPGVTFTASTGVMDWTPSLIQSGNYEFKIIGSDGSLSGSEIFTVTVNNTNQAPVLSNISNQTIDEGIAMTAVNATDGADDMDVDGDAITYSCFYDNTVDAAVASTTSCTSLTGMTFVASTGVMNWTPSFSQAGNYEFKIIGSDGSLSDSKIFTITVNDMAPFISLWRVTAGTSVTLPLKSGFTYNFIVDWGDGSAVGTVTSFGDADKSHNYTNAGDYTITISGVLTGWGFNNGSSKSLIIKVIDLGNTKLTDLSGGFLGCNNLTDFAGGNTSLVTSMVNMFGVTPALVNLDVSSFDTSKVTNMQGMFTNTTNLVSLNLSNFNTSEVTSMNAMFAYANKLVTLDLSSFNTSKVTDMSYMFAASAGASLVSVNLSSFNTSNVTTMSSMFTGAAKLVSLDLSSFNTAKVTNMLNMFQNTSSLVSLDISNFNTAAVTAMDYMFMGASKLTALDLSHFNTANVTGMSSMFQATVALASLNISNFNTAKVTNMNAMFQSATALTSLDLSSFNTSAVINMTSMFNGASSLTSLDLSSFNTSKVISMYSMFQGTSKLASLDVSSFDVSKVTNFYAMFSGASELTYLDLTNFHTTSATAMNNMFQSCSKLATLLIPNFQTQNVINMSSMFSNTKLSSLDLSHFNTANVTDMTSMFSLMQSLTSINLTSFNTSKVTNMAGMFSNTSALLVLDVSMFDTSKVANMSSMFYNNSVVNLNLSSFTTPLVTNFSSMFQNAQFTTLTAPNMSPTAAVNMSQMFFQANQVTSLDLSHFRTPNVTNMGAMFQGTNKLTSLNVSNWDISKAGTPTNVFTSANAGIVVTCNQGGAPATGTFFGKTCN